MEEDRLGYVKGRIDQINKVLDNLWDLAKADDKVTDDERNILESVKVNIENYKNLAKKLMQGDEISDDALEKIYVFEKQIVQSASAQALADGHITGEEGDLIQLLINFFTELNED